MIQSVNFATLRRDLASQIQNSREDGDFSVVSWKSSRPSRDHGICHMSTSASTNDDAPLYNLLADGGLVDEATAVTAISALVELLFL